MAWRWLEFASRKNRNVCNATWPVLSRIYLHIPSLCRDRVYRVQRDLFSTSGCCTRSRGWRDRDEICDSNGKGRCTMLASGNHKRHMRQSWASGLLPTRAPARITRACNPHRRVRMAGTQLWPMLVLQLQIPYLPRVSVRVYPTS